MYQLNQLNMLSYLLNQLIRKYKNNRGEILREISVGQKPTFLTKKVNWKLQLNLSEISN